MDPVDQEALSEVAWARLKEAVETGRITLDSKEIRELSTGDLTRVLSWLAGQTLKRKPKKVVGLPEDFTVKPTGGGA